MKGFKKVSYILKIEADFGKVEKYSRFRLGKKYVLGTMTLEGRFYA